MALDPPTNVIQMLSRDGRPALGEYDDDQEVVTIDEQGRGKIIIGEIHLGDDAFRISSGSPLRMPTARVFDGFYSQVILSQTPGLVAVSGTHWTTSYNNYKTQGFADYPEYWGVLWETLAHEQTASNTRDQSFGGYPPEWEAPLNFGVGSLDTGNVTMDGDGEWSWQGVINADRVEQNHYRAAWWMAVAKSGTYPSYRSVMRVKGANRVAGVEVVKSTQSTAIFNFGGQLNTEEGVETRYMLRVYVDRSRITIFGSQDLTVLEGNEISREYSGNSKTVIEIDVSGNVTLQIGVVHSSEQNDVYISERGEVTLVITGINPEPSQQSVEVSVPEATIQGRENIYGRGSIVREWAYSPVIEEKTAPVEFSVTYVRVSSDG